MMKFFRKIHLWLSVPFGVIITLICFSGAMLIFEHEITRALQHDVYYVTEVKKRPLPMAEIVEAVGRTLPDSVSVTGVTVFADKDRTYQVSLSSSRRASVFVDQYSGRITGKYERIGFFTKMFRLHRYMLDSANPREEGIKAGKWLVGVSTLVFVVALITGIIIWWPRVTKGGLRRSLSISLSNGWPGFWKGLHVAGGMYVVVFVLAMALTGLTWSYQWYRTAFYTVFGAGGAPRIVQHTTLPTGRGDKGADKSEACGFDLWQQVYDELATKNPGAPKITVGHGTAIVFLNDSGNGRATDRYKFNRKSGELKVASAYSDVEKSIRLRGWVYSTHIGSIGGIFTRIIWFLSALLGASLPLTGYYIWIRHLLKKKRHD